ncbi:hypothetical protein BBJ28_00021719 [Nothophytophthora sp. Chile5]|nr:hypothetical protein BBJ28_00021719 [Nothophytophthora sp. Chile5]
MIDTTLPLPSLLEAFDARLARLEAHLGVEGVSVSDADSVELAPQLQAYDEYVTQYSPPFLIAREKLGEGTRKLGEVTEKAFAAQRAFLLMASQCKKPATLKSEHLRDLQACIGEANTLRDNRSEFANHQKC